MEVAILQANIEIGAYGIIDLRQGLPGKLAIAAAELMDVCIARADANAAADTGFAPEVEPAIDHRIPRVGFLIDT